MSARSLRIPRFLPQDVCGISLDFSRLSPTPGYVPMCYSPVRHSTRRVAPTFAFDLHVLGMPPAFNLSQDQTLQFNPSNNRLSNNLLSNCLQTVLPARAHITLKVIN